MNKNSRKKLKTWLRKSLANHPENDNGLVAYVEAIVGDAEGPVRSFRVVIVRVAFLEDQCYCLGADFGLTTRNNLRSICQLEMRQVGSATRVYGVASNSPSYRWAWTRRPNTRRKHLRCVRFSTRHHLGFGYSVPGILTSSLSYTAIRSFQSVLFAQFQHSQPHPSSADTG